MNNKPKTAHKGTESVNKSITPKKQKAMKKLKKAGIKDIREIRPDFDYPIFVWPRPEAETEVSEQTGDASADETKVAVKAVPDDAGQNEPVAEPADNASAE